MSVDPTAAASTVPPAGLDPDTGHHHADGMLKLAFGAIGIVFGDIGTSPLYAFRETFAGHHKLALDSAHIMGVISLMFWSMMIVVTVKYVIIIMRADNKGEGGSLALLALVYTWGPRDLDLDVEAVIEARDADARRAAAVALFPEGGEPVVEGPL